jgi:hypothetical protein
MTVNRRTDGGAPADGSHRRNPEDASSLALWFLPPTARAAGGGGRANGPTPRDARTRTAAAGAVCSCQFAPPGRQSGRGGGGRARRQFPRHIFTDVSYGKGPSPCDHRGCCRDRRPRRSRRSAHLKPQGQRARRGRKSGEETPAHGFGCVWGETPGQEAPRPPPWSSRNRDGPAGAIPRASAPKREDHRREGIVRPEALHRVSPGGESHGEARAALCRVPVRASTPPRGTEASELAPQGVINP